LEAIMPRFTRSTIPVLLRLDARAREPLFRQIDTQLREAMLSGRLRPGTALPSTRLLAAELGVSRNTVRQAFDQLIAEGFIESEIGAGTRVAAGFALQQPGAVREPTRPRRGPPRAPVSRLTRRLAEVKLPQSPRAARPIDGAFRLGLPALDRFPVETWARLAGRRWRRATASQLDYGDPQGERILREALAAHLGRTRGVSCDADQVLVVSGSQGALDLIARVLLEPGSKAWVEDPGYYGALGPVLTSGTRMVPVPIDDEGLDLAYARRVAPDARAVFVTPSHQFPLGVTMSLGRRLELLEWAGRGDAWVVEDDYDSEFRYDARPLTALQGLDGGQRVIYVGTLSKTLCPSLRIGYIVLPRPLVESFVRARRFVDTHPPTIHQLVAADFITEGHYGRHLRRMRSLYRERQDALVRALRSARGSRWRVSPSGAGMHLVAWLPPGADEAQLVDTAAREGVSALGLAMFRSRSTGPPGLVLGYGSVRASRMADAIEALDRAMDACGITGVPDAAPRAARGRSRTGAVRGRRTRKG
jgi:GntR family transcriptional regulator / MocR family aminotransferase